MLAQWATVCPWFGWPEARKLAVQALALTWVAGAWGAGFALATWAIKTIGGRVREWRP